MTRELQEVLEAAGCVFPENADLRDRLILLRNHGSVPPNPTRPPNLIRRGFHIVLFDDSSRPTHYARFAGVEDEGFRAECEILDVLSSDEVAGLIVPNSRTARTSRLRVQLSNFLVRDRPFTLRTGPEGPSEWLTTARDVLDVRARLCERGSLLLPDLCRVNQPVSVLSETLEDFSAIHTNLPDEAGVSEVISALTDVEPITPSVQHGDFWSENIILTEGSCRLIDFEDFGRVRAPLYDTFHLIHSSARRGPWSAETSWLDYHPSPAPVEWRRVWRQVIDAEIDRVGISLDEAGALLVFYLVNLSAHRMRPGTGRRFAAEPVDDLKAIVGALRRKSSLADLLPSG